MYEVLNSKHSYEKLAMILDVLYTDADVYVG
jgi:hypothetical protein